MKVEIDLDPYGFNKYYSGEIIVDEGDSLEVKKVCYEFTLTETYNANNDYTDISIEFIDEIPKNRILVEEKIKEEFDDKNQI